MSSSMGRIIPWLSQYIMENKNVAIWDYISLKDYATMILLDDLL